MSQKHLNLDRLVPILKNEFSNELQGVRPTEIEFFNNNDRTTSLDCGMTLTNDNTSSKNPLVIRYPLSDSSNIYTKWCTAKFHFYLLKREAIAKFKNDLAEIEMGDIYFEDQNNQGIESAFHFNTLLNNIDQNGQNQYDLNLKI
ncbi:hypothetical protein RhiirA1_465207 [Rhizophagus irregularis]|uniref:Uncharacterized protein n=1 Tax=Rhizophagus irregularis TaxID=588596 RepID=A0A2I1EXX1_9GLOM|nr:hypothetical protein RhiirA1_465207 [Rhizophagus irregularis]PKY26948.1 hypothetical protein RhiirB3_442443 [Rhizophagus irregularis]PKY29797.1 hypothetical protein RhiirB3_446560 [Rhizophagus irregularis]